MNIDSEADLITADIKICDAEIAPLTFGNNAFLMRYVATEFGNEHLTTLTYFLFSLQAEFRAQRNDMKEEDARRNAMIAFHRKHPVASEVAIHAMAWQASIPAADYKRMSEKALALITSANNELSEGDPSAEPSGE